MGQPPPPPGSERRRTHRVELLAQVQLRRGDGEVFLLPVANISAGGAFLRLEPGVGISSLMVGDQVDIFLDLGSSFTLDLPAQVLRIDVIGGEGRMAGIGLRWTGSDPALQDRLAAALKHLSHG
jgi:Tfp pilus assembly protein PilZ